MNLKKIVENINFKGEPDDRQIFNIVHDSRKVKQGSLFVAISGKRAMVMILFLKQSIKEQLQY